MRQLTNDQKHSKSHAMIVMAKNCEARLEL